MMRARLVVAGLVLSAWLPSIASAQLGGLDALEAGGPDLQVIAPAGALPAKARVNIFLEVLNVGPGDANQLSVLVQPGPGSPLVVVGQAERGLQNVPQGGSALLVVRLATPADAGGASLLLRFAFIDEAGVARVVTRSVSILISPPESDPLEATFLGTTVGPGESGNLTLTLRNPSRRVIEDLDVTVTERSAFTPFTTDLPRISPGGLGSLVVQGATLLPGETRVLVVPIVTGLRAEDLQSFLVEATYNYEGFARSQAFEFGARVVGDVTIRVLEAREIVTANGLEVVGTLVNTGTATAWNPRVTVAEASGLVAPRPDLVEDLEPNDAVDFRLRVERVFEPEGSAPLIALDYNDDFGNVKATTAATADDLARLPEPEGGWLRRAWSNLGWPLVLALLAGMLLAGALAVSARVLRERHAAESAEGAEDEDERPEPARRTGRRHKPKPGA